MVYPKSTFLLLALWAAASEAATYYDKLPAAIKRAVDNYNYPQPIITFQENPKKTVVETLQSVSPVSNQGRYLPPGPTAATNSGPNSPPISVSFNGYEPPAAPAQTKPVATAATAPPPVSAAATPGTNTAQKKRPSGGLGGFKYYGGSGASSSSSSGSSNSAAAAPISTSAPAAPASVNPVKVEPAAEKPKVASKPGYDYPSPKSNRKPSKKEQKLADSKPEESAQGYHYDVGPAAFASGVQTFSAGSSGSSGGMMGLSYMRQSSPYYSYHVMLD